MNVKSAFNKIDKKDKMANYEQEDDFQDNDNQNNTVKSQIEENQEQDTIEENAKLVAKKLKEPMFVVSLIKFNF